ncbi:MAG: lipase maturation factor family protein, partial [Acidobacteriota bacterium]
IAWGGVALSAISILARPHSRWQRLIFIILFVYYLSIVSAGQIFMSYQWDLLLLETGFLAIFLSPSRPRVWLFQWLLFRLMFESGAVKLLSHDTSWRDLTALAVHYETQPLPTVLAWYAHQLPLWFQKASTAATLAIELFLPFLIFFPRRLKQLAGFGFITLQTLILLTGNYTFFNLLAIALCLFLFDDAFFARKKKTYRPLAPARPNRVVSTLVIAAVMTLSCIELGGMFGVAPEPLGRVADAVSPFGIVNQYGLFAVMTTKRPEVEIEGSNDGQHWLPYVFRYKAGPFNRAPGWVAPFQPRLDWQMWFAALGTFRQNPWFVRFVIALLEGSKPVLALLEHDPFNGKPPLQIRAMLYEYHFTTFAERRKTGNWWKREEKGIYFPPVGLSGPAGQ